MSNERTATTIPPSDSKIEGDAHKLPVWRVEWRPHLTNHWCIIGSYNGYEDALDAVGGAREKWDGQVRVVQQTVKYVEGLGEDDASL